jgi:hypothetical protein
MTTKHTDLLAERDRLREQNAELVEALEATVTTLDECRDYNFTNARYSSEAARAALAKCSHPMNRSEA